MRSILNYGFYKYHFPFGVTTHYVSKKFIWEIWLSVAIYIVVFVCFFIINLYYYKHIYKDFYEDDILESVWTLIPFFLLFFILVPELFVLKTGQTRLTKLYKNIIKLVGHQWYWE